MAVHMTDQLHQRLRMLMWAVAYTGLAAVGCLLLVFFVVSTALVVVWFGIPLLILATTLVRALADGHRRWLGELLDTPIPSPYRAVPETRNLLSRAWAILRDPATWRDALWLLLNVTAGLILTALPLGFLSQALQTLVLPLLWPLMPDNYVHWVLFIPVTSQATALLTLPVGLVLLLLAWLLLPYCLRLYARLAHTLLAPTERQRLARRVEDLFTTRADSVDAHAAEVRRIERDLHDGAQARLVALGMSLGMAENMLRSDPNSARQLLAEARDSTHHALTELRDLVRGIHPPVLVERGLDGAVRALALTQPFPIDVDISIPGRPVAPVESAVYFAVAESLANVAKHSGAERAWVRINYGGGRLVTVVGDDGSGGADPAAGTGLRGIERRLGSFDGNISIASPPGGPTIVTMELPCALSSPKTSPSSATD